MNPGLLEAKIVLQKGQRLAVMSLSGSIGLPAGFTSNDFTESLIKLGDHDVLYTIMDSSGGSPMDAWSIFNFLKKTSHSRDGALVLITRECVGDALLIAQGFDQILMRTDACIEFRPAKLRSSTATRVTTKVMARLIAKRAGCRLEDVLGWMDKNKRFTAEECLARGICDAIV
jgi:ATP-dependent protease ClpP protease subunit